MAAKSGAILSGQKLGYAKYLSKKRIKPFSGCPHLMRYSMILVSLLTGLHNTNDDHQNSRRGWPEKDIKENAML